MLKLKNEQDKNYIINSPSRRNLEIKKRNDPNIPAIKDEQLIIPLKTTKPTINTRTKLNKRKTKPDKRGRYSRNYDYDIYDYLYDDYYNGYIYHPNQYHNYRFPYWNPLWMQYYDPYLRIYNVPILVPTEDKLTKGENIEDDKGSPKLKSKSTTFSTYASFDEPIIVKRNLDNRFGNMAIDDNNVMEQFKQDITQTHQRPRYKPHYKAHSRNYKSSWNYNYNPYLLYEGPYVYHPFSGYFYTDPNIILPFDINKAILPIKLEEDVKDNIKKDDKKVVEKFEDIKVPKGYKIIKVKLIEIEDKQNIDKTKILTIIILMIMIGILGYGIFKNII